MKRKWFDKKVLVLGLSKSGISAAKYLNSVGAECYISESRQAAPADIELMKELESEGIHTEAGAHSDEFIEDAYLCIVSPGIPPSAEVFSRLKAQKVPFISEIELAYLETATPFIAITGTNGKTTTTYLTSHILEAAYKAPFCGNIGVPPTSLLDKKYDYFVCELSSYQIENSPTFRPQIACYLNFTPDHISWHGSLENYFKSKSKLFDPCKMPAFAVFNATDEKIYNLAMKYNDEKYFFGKEFDKNCCFIEDSAIYFKKNKKEKIIDLSEISLVGEHNHQNVMCAIIVAKIIGLENNVIENRIKTFEAVEHRCEFVANVDGIEFYNDSKATNPESSIVAINSFENKTITLIAGGRDKNTDLSEFCGLINKKVKNVILLGEAKERFEEALREVNYTNITIASSLEDAIDKARMLHSEVILFSPACASFDMYENYEQRGKAFKEYVTSKISK